MEFNSRRRLTAILIAGMYAVVSCASVFVRDLLSPFEIPWFWLWILWAGLFALPTGVIIFRIGISDRVTIRLATLSVLFVLLVVACMQVALHFDLHAGTVFPVILALTAVAWFVPR